MTNEDRTPRFHITAKGNTGICRAQWSCKLGDIDKEHFDSREEAIAWRDQKAARISIEPVGLAKEILEKIEASGQNTDVPKFLMQGIQTDSYWKDNEKEDLAILSEIQEILSDPDHAKIAEAKKLLKSMNGIDPFARRFSDSNNRYKRRDYCIESLAEDVVEYAIGGLYEPMRNAPDRAKNTRIFGLEQARIEAVNNMNMIGYDEDRKQYFFCENVEEFLEDTLNRIAAGEVYEHELMNYTSSAFYSARDENKLIAALSNEEDSNFSRPLYLMTVFPDNELREAFDRMNIENVSVSFAPNGREDGFAYTVIQPNGDARTFGVFEHRNTDSIIISGATNWDGKGGSPRNGNTKQCFFAEFAPEDRRQAADTLAFFIKAAQKGELESDEILEATVERRDWISILSKQIPGFGDWAEKNGFVKDTTPEEKLFGEGIHMPKIYISDTDD